MSRPGVLLVAVAFSAPQLATIGGRRTANPRAPSLDTNVSWPVFHQARVRVVAGAEVAGRVVQEHG